MAEESATCTYLINEPFATALKSLRTALADANLKITGELDLAARTRRALLMTIPPCTVLFASLSTLKGEELAAEPFGAAVTPMHVVVSARGSRTEVHFLRVLPRLEGSLGQPALATFAQLQRSLARAVERIGMRSLDA